MVDSGLYPQTALHLRCFLSRGCRRQQILLTPCFSVGIRESLPTSPCRRHDTLPEAIYPVDTAAIFHTSGMVECCETLILGLKPEVKKICCLRQLPSKPSQLHDFKTQVLVNSLKHIIFVIHKEISPHSNLINYKQTCL